MKRVLQFWYSFIGSPEYIVSNLTPHNVPLVEYYWGTVFALRLVVLIVTYL